MSPLYNSKLPIPFLCMGYPSDYFLVFSADAVLTGQFSQQVSIPLSKVGGARGIRVELDFSADPGNFEIDVMESTRIDVAGTGQNNFQQVPTGGALTQANKTTGINGANTHCGTDQIPFAGLFACLFVKTQPSNGGITVTARIVRTA
jgi:hypothetical protein